MDTVEIDVDDLLPSVIRIEQIVTRTAALLHDQVKEQKEIVRRLGEVRKNAFSPIMMNVHALVIDFVSGTFPGPCTVSFSLNYRVSLSLSLSLSLSATFGTGGEKDR